MSKVVSQENLVDFGQQFKNKLSAVAISGSYNDLVDTPGDLQEYRQFTIFSPQAEGDTPDWPGDNDWKWYTNLDKLAPTSNPNAYYYDDWFTYAYSTGNTPIIWIATATFQSSDGSKVSDWEMYQATGSTGAPGQDGQDGADGQKGDTGNGISSITKTGTSGLVDTYTITFTNGNTTTFTVTNGADGTTGPQGVGIESIELTAQASGGSTDEYTITLTDGRTSTFDVHHGVNGTNGTNGTNGNDGNGISSITKIGTSGLVDTYRISYTNGTSSTFTITNGANGTNGTNGTNGSNGTNGDDGYYLNVDNPNIFIPVDSNGNPVDGVSEQCNIKLYKGTTRCNILDLGINDNTYTDSAIAISGNVMSITGDGNQNGYTALSIDVSTDYTLSSVENYIIYLRENSGGYTGQFVLKLIPVVQSSQLANGTIFESTDTSFTLSQLKSNSVLIADGGSNDITFTLPAGDAEMDGRTIKIMVISGGLIVTANSHATIVTLGGSTADPSTGSFPGTCVLEATYYWANGSDFIYLYQISA